MSFLDSSKSGLRIGMGGKSNTPSGGSSQNTTTSKSFSPQVQSVLDGITKYLSGVQSGTNAPLWTQAPQGELSKYIQGNLIPQSQGTSGIAGTANNWADLVANSVAGTNSGANGLDWEAAGAASKAMYSPQANNSVIQNTAQSGLTGSQAITPGQGQNLTNLMNPYTQGVINSSLNQINNQEGIDSNNLSASATQATGAFGGDRAAIAQAQLAKNYDLNKQQTISGLLSQNYGQAQNEYNTQQNQRLQQQGTLGSLLNGATGLQNQANQIGIQGILGSASNMNQTGAIANQGLLGAGNLATQGQVGLNSANQGWANILNNVGQYQTGYAQQGNNSTINNMSALENLLQGPMQAYTQTGTSTGQTTTNNDPSIGNIIGGVATIASLFMNEGGAVKPAKTLHRDMGGDIPGGVTLNPWAGGGGDLSALMASLAQSGSSSMASAGTKKDSGTDFSGGIKSLSDLLTGTHTGGLSKMGANVDSGMGLLGKLFGGDYSDPIKMDHSRIDTPIGGDWNSLAGDTGFGMFRRGGRVRHYDAGGGVLPMGLDSSDVVSQATDSLPLYTDKDLRDKALASTKVDDNKSYGLGALVSHLFGGSSDKPDNFGGIINPNSFGRGTDLQSPLLAAGAAMMATGRQPGQNPTFAALGNGINAFQSSLKDQNNTSFTQGSEITKLQQAQQQLQSLGEYHKALEQQITFGETSLTPYQKGELEQQKRATEAQMQHYSEELAIEQRRLELASKGSPSLDSQGYMGMVDPLTAQFKYVTDAEGNKVKGNFAGKGMGLAGSGQYAKDMTAATHKVTAELGPLGNLDAEGQAKWNAAYSRAMAEMGHPGESFDPNEAALAAQIAPAITAPTAATAPGVPGATGAPAGQPLGPSKAPEATQKILNGKTYVTHQGQWYAVPGTP